MAVRGFEGRIDAGEVGRGHWRVTSLSGFGWMFDAIDVGLLSFVMVALAREWGAVSGTLADRYGR